MLKSILSRFINKFIKKNETEKVSETRCVYTVKKKNNTSNKRPYNSDHKIIEKLIDEREFIDAYDAIDEYLSTNEKDDLILYLKGMVLYNLSMYQSALSLFAESALINPLGKGGQYLPYIINKKRIKGHPSRDSIGEICELFVNYKFYPKTIIDIGINTGTPGLYEFYRNSNFFLVEPLIESEPFMIDIMNKFKNVNYEICAVGDSECETKLSIHPGYGGSMVTSVGTHKNESESRIIKQYKLDTLVEKHSLTGPFMLKIDTEGSELSVLKGCPKTLLNTEVIILEAHVKPWASAPGILDIMLWLDNNNFALYDIIDRNYHDAMKCLKQFDAVFVKKNGFFRTEKDYKSLIDTPDGLFDDIVEAKLKKRRLAQNALK